MTSVANRDVEGERRSGEACGAHLRDSSLRIDLNSEGGQGVDPDGSSGGANGVGYENTPGQTFGSEHGLEGIGGQVVPIGNKCPDEAIVGQLGPEHIMVSVHLRETAVTEVGGDRGTGCRGIVNTLRRSTGVSEADNDIMLHQVFNEFEGPGNFGREGDESNSSVGRRLAALKIFDVRVDNRLKGVRAARAIKRRNIGALHMEACDHRITRFDNLFGARGKMPGVAGDDSG